jgi:hypothetical protein
VTNNLRSQAPELVPLFHPTLNGTVCHYQLYVPLFVRVAAARVFALFMPPNQNRLYILWGISHDRKHKSTQARGGLWSPERTVCTFFWSPNLPGSLSLHPRIIYEIFRVYRFSIAA